MLGFLVLKVSLTTILYAFFQQYSGYFVIETILTIKVNNILVAFALIQISNQIRSVNNSGFYKTNMADIFNLSTRSSAGAKKSLI